jgi:parallel beta-helix repeat protein
MSRSSRARLTATILAGLLLVIGLPATSNATTQHVDARDNYFEPQTVHVDPGDTVVWTNVGARDHSVTSDTGDFDSGTMDPGDNFSHTFDKEGYYYYHCRFHGAKQSGMWGVVIVGNPPPPKEDKTHKSNRPTVVVPKDYPTIQKAVDHAKPGSTVLIRPGVYHEAVSVKTSNLVIKGVDRFRTILHGRDKLDTGLLVDNARHVTVANLTARNYLGNGVFFNDTHDYVAKRIDAIKDRTYGVYAYNSYHGVFKDSFAWGSGDSGFYVGSCMGCSAIIENVHAEMNYLGYSGTNATGVVIRDSTWTHNGAGIVPNTLPTEDFPPNRGTYIIHNVVTDNNYETIPEAGFSSTAGIPFGTGVFLAGVQNNTVRNNIIKDNDRYGVLVSESIDPRSVPMNNKVVFNTLRDSGIYDLAYSGAGANDCFSGNDMNSPTGPPDIETIYACSARPFVGTPYPPVAADVVVSLTYVATREQKEPPEPHRPSCQAGAPGCHRRATHSHH